MRALPIRPCLLIRGILLVIILAAVPLTLSWSPLQQANAQSQPRQICGPAAGAGQPAQCTYQQDIPGNSCTGGAFSVSSQDYEVVIQSNGSFFLADRQGNPVTSAVQGGAEVAPNAGCELAVFNPMTGLYSPAGSLTLSGGSSYALLPLPQPPPATPIATPIPTTPPPPSSTPLPLPTSSPIPPPTSTPIPQPSSTPRHTATATSTGTAPPTACKIVVLNPRLRKQLCKLVLILNRLNHLPIIVIILPNGFLEFKGTNRHQLTGMIDLVVTDPHDILVRINPSGSYTVVDGRNLPIALDGKPHYAVVSRLLLPFSATSTGRSIMVGEGTFKNVPKDVKIRVVVGGMITFSPKLKQAIQVTPLRGFVLQIQVTVKVKGKTTLVWRTVRTNLIPKGTAARFAELPNP